MKNLDWVCDLRYPLYPGHEVYHVPSVYWKLYVTTDYERPGKWIAVVGSVTREFASRTAAIEWAEHYFYQKGGY